MFGGINLNLKDKIEALWSPSVFQDAVDQATSEYRPGRRPMQRYRGAKIPPPPYGIDHTPLTPHNVS